MGEERKISEVLGETIRMYRKLLKLTQQDVAEYMKVKSATVSAWEKGVNEMNLSQLQKLSNYFQEMIDTNYNGINTDIGISIGDSIVNWNVFDCVLMRMKECNQKFNIDSWNLEMRNFLIDFLVENYNKEDIKVQNLLPIIYYLLDSITDLVKRISKTKEQD